MVMYVIWEQMFRSPLTTAFSLCYIDKKYWGCLTVCEDLWILRQPKAKSLPCLGSPQSSSRHKSWQQSVKEKGAVVSWMHATKPGDAHSLEVSSVKCVTVIMSLWDPQSLKVTDNVAHR